MANGSDVYDWGDGNDDDLDFRSARYALQRVEVAIAVVEHFQMTQDSPGNDTVVNSNAVSLFVDNFVEFDKQTVIKKQIPKQSDDETSRLVYFCG